MNGTTQYRQWNNNLEQLSVRTARTIRTITEQQSSKNNGEQRTTEQLLTRTTECGDNRTTEQ
jgi:hypothetical protein